MKQQTNTIYSFNTMKWILFILFFSLNVSAYSEEEDYEYYDYLNIIYIPIEYLVDSLPFEDQLEFYFGHDFQNEVERYIYEKIVETVQNADLLFTIGRKTFHFIEGSEESLKFSKFMTSKIEKDKAKKSKQYVQKFE